MTAVQDQFPRLKVLIVEDEVLVGMMLEDMLVEIFGCEVAAHCTRLDEGLAAAESLDLDAAFLDLNLRGESSLPIAAVLKARGVPVLLTSGYGQFATPPEEGLHMVAKPYTADQIGEALARAVKRRVD